MSEPKFTPGPWFAHEGYAEQDYVYSRDDKCTSKHIICKVFTRPKTEVRGCPDAYLIAAAPELYRFLKMATEEACSACAMMMVDPASYDFIENGCPFANQNELCEYRDCIAILRKAHGESEVEE